MVRRLSAITVLVVLVFGCLGLAPAGMFGAAQSAWAEQAAQATQTGLVNINTASVDELATLKGIGEKTAQAIVAHREAKGPFAETEDIVNVKGVGRKKYEAIKDHLTVKAPK